MTVTREPDTGREPLEGPVGCSPAPLPGGRVRGGGPLLAVLAVTLAVAVAAASVGVRSVGPVTTLPGAARSGTTRDPGVPVRAVASVVDITSRLAGGADLRMGTGIVLSGSGMVLTNNHVIEGAAVTAATDVGNGRTYRATVVGSDATEDLAVLQLSGASGLTTADLGSSVTASVGEQVTALGNAGGAGGTPAAAHGRITALGVSITARDDATGVSEDLDGLIQTDAPIRDGDSGGPLLDASGRVIGIDTAATSGYHFRFREGATTAYAIPLDHALAVADRITSGPASAARLTTPRG